MTKLMTIGLMCILICTSVFAKQEKEIADEPQPKESEKIKIAIHELSFTEDRLEFVYEFSNSLDKDVWICTKHDLEDPNQVKITIRKNALLIYLEGVKTPQDLFLYVPQSSAFTRVRAHEKYQDKISLKLPLKLSKDPFEIERYVKKEKLIYTSNIIFGIEYYDYDLYLVGKKFRDKVRKKHKSPELVGIIGIYEGDPDKVVVGSKRKDFKYGDRVFPIGYWTQENPGQIKQINLINIPYIMEYNTGRQLEGYGTEVYRPSRKKKLNKK